MNVLKFNYCYYSVFELNVTTVKMNLCTCKHNADLLVIFSMYISCGDGYIILKVSQVSLPVASPWF